MASVEISRVALTTFFNVMKKWQIEQIDQISLLGVNFESEFISLQQGHYSLLSNTSLIRISYIIRIYKSLSTLLPSEAQSNSWIHKPNKKFNGNSVLCEILDGGLEKLEIVANYLQKQIDLLSMKM